jgi:hypothetical protein
MTDARWSTRGSRRASAATPPFFARQALADDPDEGVIELDARASVGQYIEATKQQRVWDREARLSESDA